MTARSECGNMEFPLRSKPSGMFAPCFSTHACGCVY
jgi:hypothetical protein